jgi:predicted ABC-type ATPase
MTQPALPPTMILLAGPNGSGKSTIAEELLPAGAVFLNTDIVAAGLSEPTERSRNMKAGRIVLDHMERLTRRGADFMFETTLSSRGLEGRVKEIRSLGYKVTLIFLWVASERVSIERVASRVRAGGHHVPELVIRRRYRHAIANFFRFRDFIDGWYLYDNSDYACPHLVAFHLPPDGMLVLMPETWQHIQSLKEGIQWPPKR